MSLGSTSFFKTIPGIRLTEAGRANGSNLKLDGSYDGYVECVKIEFDPHVLTVANLMSYLFEIIDPYSINRQGEDIGKKYRTGLYSNCKWHLQEARDFINMQEDVERIVVEILELKNYVRSAEENQDRLDKFPTDYCHISYDLLHKYN